jgi:hypothetical protein
LMDFSERKSPEKETRRDFRGLQTIWPQAGDSLKISHDLKPEKIGICAKFNSEYSN